MTYSTHHSETLLWPKEATLDEDQLPSVPDIFSPSPPDAPSTLPNLLCPLRG